MAIWGLARTARRTFQRMELRRVTARVSNQARAEAEALSSLTTAPDAPALPEVRSTVAYTTKVRKYVLYTYKRLTHGRLVPHPASHISPTTTVALLEHS